MAKSKITYREARWKVEIEVTETTVGGAERDNKSQSEIVNLKPYISKYPSKSGVFKAFRTASALIVKLVCFIAAIIGIFKFLSG